MLTIYSVGDAWYLGKVMDAIAMISGSNEGFVGASMVAALIGVFVIGFQSILKITLNIHELLVCYIIYMGCFSIQTDVVIESVYSDKTVIQKDNVPYGPAVLGSIISEIGYKLTQKMEVAFSDVHQGTLLTDPNGSQGYANALYLINNLARWSEKNGADTLPTAQNSSFAKNIRTYAMDCTTKALYLGKEFGGKEWKDLKTNSFINALGFNSDVYGTELYINNRAESYTCKEGINAIKNEFKNMLSAIDAGGNESARKEMLVNVGLCKNTQECNANIATNITDLVQNNLDALRVRNYDINDFMMAAVGMNELYTGLSLGYSSMFDKQSATMILNAVQQRNIQWGAEQNMFLQSVRPMLSFIEGLFYAISPFAAIMVMLGLFGLKIFFKYIILLIWIQLWLPIMAIANHYIMASASEAIDKLPYQGTGDNMGMSLYFYENLVQICQTKIAVGGMMMAATPVLSLMLITGSVYAMTQLTNRMSGGDHINEKMIAPDVVGTAPIMMMSPGSTNDAYTSKESGAKFKEISVGETLNSTSQYAHNESMVASRNLASAFQSSFGSNGAHNYGNNLTRAAIEADHSSYAQGFNKIVNDVFDKAHSQNANVTRADAAAATLDALVNARAGNKKFAVGAGGGNSLSSSLTGTTAESRSAAESVIKGFTDSEQANLLHQVGNSITKDNSDGNAYSQSASNLDSVSKTLQTSITASDQYSSTKAVQDKIDSSLKMDSVELAARMEDKKLGGQYGTIAKLEEEIKGIYRGNFDSVVRNMENRNHKGSSNYAHEAAVLEAIDSIKGNDDAINNKFAEYIAPHFGIDPNIYKDMSETTHNNGKINTSGLGITEDEVNAKIKQNTSFINEQETAAKKAVKFYNTEKFYNSKLGKLIAQRTKQRDDIQNEHFNKNLTKAGYHEEITGKPINDSAILRYISNVSGIDNTNASNYDFSNKWDRELLNNRIDKIISPIFSGTATRDGLEASALAAAKDQMITSIADNYQTYLRGDDENGALFKQNFDARNKTIDAYYNLAKARGASDGVAKSYANNIANAIDKTIYQSATSKEDVMIDVLNFMPRNSKF